MKTVFYALISDLYYYRGGGYLMVNSFKRFHPDIDLVVFRQDTIDEIIDFSIDKYRAKAYIDSNGKRKIPGYIAKAVFAKLLTKKYDKVVNIDSDHIITGRFDAILKDDWDVGGVWNFNDYENASFDNITPEMYVQCGIVGATNSKFWDYWEEANNEAEKYIRFENDTLNLILYNHPEVSKMKLKIFDKDKDYYGCKSLGREWEMYIENDELMLRGEKVKAYHHAKGPSLPKLDFPNMGFRSEVVEWLTKVGNYGISVKHGKI